MNYQLLYDNPEESLTTRLLKIRKIDDQLSDFLAPTYRRYRQAPANLSDIDKARQRIIDAIQRNEKIMIFGDYDVDGIVSSYLLYTFFRKYLDYHHISIRLPDRLQDGYGIKSHHIDEVDARGCTLIITVDNGITALEEAIYASQLGVDMIVTDHHQLLGERPAAYAVVNPQCSEQFSFKEICGASVAFKLCMHLAEQLIPDHTIKKQLLTDLLPFVSIATVADCMPLIDENRLLVKKGLDIMNTRRELLAPSLQQLLTALNIKTVDTFHIGFMIAPRINATGRMGYANDGLNCLLSSDYSLLNRHIQRLDELNTLRKKTQDQMLEQVREQVDTDQPILIASSSEFHEGIVGIVAGRVTEQHYKPSLIMGIDHEKGIATGSLRGPDYFNIVQMLKSADDLLLRYGGHEQAGGLTVKLENLAALTERLLQYCSDQVTPEMLEKTITVDTRLHDHELDHDSETIDHIQQFGPYGEGNPEPQFLLSDVTITDLQTVGKNSSSHLKLHATKDDKSFTIMQRGKGDQIDKLAKGTTLELIGKLKKDTYNGGFYIDGKELITK